MEKDFWWIYEMSDEIGWRLVVLEREIRGYIYRSRCSCLSLLWVEHFVHIFQCWKTGREGGCMIEQESCSPEKPVSSLKLSTSVCSRLRHRSIRSSCSDV